MKDVVEILCDLIAIPSVNPMGGGDTPSNIAGEARVDEYIFDFIKRLGIEPFVQETALPGRANVGGIIHCGGARKTLLFQSHTDTVGLGGDMKLLKPVRRNGRIYGRGACDCKGGLAAMLAAFAEAAKKPKALSCDIIVMGVSDEELGGAGSMALVSKEPTMDADFGIIGEPTESRILNAGKGVARWDISTDGVAFHSSEPEKGVNAIYRMAKIVSAIERYQGELANVVDEPLGCETASVGVIAGGICVNTVPDACSIQVDRRLTRLTTPEEAYDDMARFLKEQGCEPFKMSPLKDAHAAVSVEESHPGVQMMIAAAAKSGLDSKPGTAAFGSDAFRMNPKIPTVLWGSGSIRNAHGMEEHVSINELENAAKFYLQLMRSVWRNE